MALEMSATTSSTISVPVISWHADMTFLMMDFICNSPSKAPSESMNMFYMSTTMLMIRSFEEIVLHVYAYVVSVTV